MGRVHEIRGCLWGFFVVDRRLMHGWRNSPWFYCLLPGAIEHAHRSASFDDTFVTPQGLTATRHVRVDVSAAREAPVQLPPNCGVPPARGEEAADTFWARAYVDNTTGVEPLACGRGSRFFTASSSLASGHFRHLGHDGLLSPLVSSS